MTRYGGGDAGLARAKAMALVMLALPGAVFVYNGEELGLPNVELPDEVLQDPVWFRSGGRERGRDACRVPMPWKGRRAAVRLLRQLRHMAADAAKWASLTVERQLAEPNSTLQFFTRGLGLRREFTGTAVQWLKAPTGALMFRVGGLVCALNVSAKPFALPAGELLFTSGPLVEGQAAARHRCLGGSLTPPRAWQRGSDHAQEFAAVVHRAVGRIYAQPRPHRPHPDHTVVDEIHCGQRE